MLSVLAALVLSSSPEAGAHTGTLDPKIITKVINGQGPVLRRGVEEAQANDGGIVKVRFVIGRDGRVTSAELAEPSTAPVTVVRCVLATVKAVKWAAPRGGTVEVVYPFLIEIRGEE